MIIEFSGEGLGSSRKGISDPIQAGNVKKDHLGVGANNPGDVTPEDDIYEQYKKRMMLGYRYRPNPLVCMITIPFWFSRFGDILILESLIMWFALFSQNNPRKAYY